MPQRPQALQLAPCAARSTHTHTQCRQFDFDGNEQWKSYLRSVELTNDSPEMLTKLKVRHAKRGMCGMQGQRAGGRLRRNPTPRSMTDGSMVRGGSARLPQLPGRDVRAGKE